MDALDTQDGVRVSKQDQDLDLESMLRKAEECVCEAKSLYKLERVAAAAEKTDEAMKIVAECTSLKSFSSQECNGQDESKQNQVIGEQSNTNIYEDFASLKKKIKSDPIISCIYKDLATIEEILRDVYSEEDWKVQRKGNKSKDDIRVLYKLSEDDPLIILRIQGEMPSPLLGPLSVLNEVDLYHTWIPFMNFGIGKCGLDSSFTIEQLSVVSKIVHLNFICPWPFDNRDLILVGHGYNLLAEKGTIVVTLKSPTLFGEDETFHLRREDGETSTGNTGDSNSNCSQDFESNGDDCKDNKRLRMEGIGHVVFKYVDENRCFCQCQMKVDVKLKYIPAPVLNFVTRTVASTVFGFFKKKSVEIFRDSPNDGTIRAKNPDDSEVTNTNDEKPPLYASVIESDIKNSHRARVDAGSEFYDFVRNSLKQYEKNLEHCDESPELKIGDSQ